MKPHRPSLSLLLLIVLICMGRATAFGQSNVWNDINVDSWNDATNWSLGVLPTSLQDVEINNSGNAVLTGTPGSSKDVYLGRNALTGGYLYVGGQFPDNITGVLNSRIGYVGHTGGGAAFVRGTNSNWTTTDDLYFGYHGDGYL